MASRSMIFKLRNRGGRSRVFLVVALLFQLAIGNAIHAFRMSEDAEWLAQSYGVICTTDVGTSDPDHALHQTNHDCCLAGSCCAPAAPGPLGAAAWAQPTRALAENLSPRLAAAVALGARYPSDVGARAPPAIVL